MQSSASSGKKVILLRPRGFAPAWCAQSMLSRLRWTYTARRSTCAKRLSITGTWWTICGTTGDFRGRIVQVPAGSRVIFSAHGVSPEVRRQAQERSLQVVDATCPLVTKVHLEAVKFARQNSTILLIGHRDHEEIDGTYGEARGTRLSWRPKRMPKR